MMHTLCCFSLPIGGTPPTGLSAPFLFAIFLPIIMPAILCLKLDLCLVSTIILSCLKYTKLMCHNFIVSFLICLVDEEVVARLVQNTTNLLIANTTLPPSKARVPQNHGQPEDIFTIRVTDSEFYITIEQLQQDMMLQGVEDESWLEVVVGG